MADTKERNFLIYITEVGYNRWDSAIMLNGHKIGGMLGGLHEVMINLSNRCINCQADGEWRDPFVRTDEEIVLYGEVAGDPRKPKTKVTEDV